MSRRKAQPSRTGPGGAAATRRAVLLAVAGLTLAGCGGAIDSAATADRVGAGAARHDVQAPDPMEDEAGTSGGQSSAPVRTTVLGAVGTATVPTAALAGPVSGGLGRELVFDASGSASPLGLQVTYRWDFDSDGRWDLTGTDPVVTHSYAAPYQGPATVKVGDTIGQTASAAVQVTVTQDGDAVGAGDNCPAEPNDDQGDHDGDGLGDACDPDSALDQRNDVRDDGD